MLCCPSSQLRRAAPRPSTRPPARLAHPHLTWRAFGMITNRVSTMITSNRPASARPAAAIILIVLNTSFTPCGWAGSG